jgi:hypothetical protein
VIPHAVGPVDGVLSAFLEGRLDGRALPLAGCGGPAGRGRPSGGRRAGADGETRDCGGRRGRRFGVRGGGRRGGRS